MIRKSLAATLAALALTACTSTPPPEPAPVADAATSRTIQNGALIGYAEGGAHVWRAIPFAAPPQGDLRWRAPRPPASWEGVREALTSAAPCPQRITFLHQMPDRMGELLGEEDCLYLDVYAPAMSAEAAAQTRLPVMMWIHGGSNMWGSAAAYNGATLAARRNVIVVVVQYRLGPLGWMAHPALRADPEFPEDASANFGNLDTIRALEWIRDNVSVFGGDPGRVTIFGESAGGHDVAALIASPRAAGLFHRAIVQSGSFDTVPLAEAENGSEDFAFFGRSIAQSIAPGEASAEALRAAPLQAVFDAIKSDDPNAEIPRVIADGVILPPDGIRAALADPARYNAVPIMTGTNRDETRLFNAFTPELSYRLFGLFPRAKDETLYERVSTYQSRMWRADAVDAPAQAMTAGGHPNVYAYRFDWDEQGRILFSDLSLLLGAAHAIEIPFVFGHFELLGQFDRYAFTEKNAPGRLALSEAMMGYWANFAATGDPGRGPDGSLPQWNAWTNAGAPNLMVFDTEAGGGVRMIADLESPARVAADLFADQALENDAIKCRVFAATAFWNDELDGADAGRCPGG